MNKHPVLGVEPADVFGAVYNVRLRFRDRICGGVPKDPAVQIKWLETKGFTNQEAREYVERLRKEKPDNEEYVEEQLARTWSGFKCDARGLYIEARQIEAMLREAATELAITTSRTKGVRQRLQHGCFVKPERIHLIDPSSADGRPGGRFLTEPTGDETRLVHAKTPKGPISAFKRFDFVERAEIEFGIWVVQSRKLTQTDLRRMLVLAEEQGLGSNRSQGEGKFDVLAFERISGTDEEEEKDCEDQSTRPAESGDGPTTSKRRGTATGGRKSPRSTATASATR